jgi:hypothetical protein
MSPGFAALADAEAGMTIPSEPVLFMKAPSCLSVSCSVNNQNSGPPLHGLAFSSAGIANQRLGTQANRSPKTPDESTRTRPSRLRPGRDAGRLG